jgi:hypothetical protein
MKNILGNQSYKNIVPPRVLIGSDVSLECYYNYDTLSSVKWFYKKTIFDYHQEIFTYEHQNDSVKYSQIQGISIDVR